MNDTERRYQGNFPTPEIFVRFAYQIIEEKLGKNWKEEYVIYDCCCGCLGLTKYCQFKELYCSTLIQEELELSNQYNHEATKWQMDFLNDSDEKIDKKLINVFKENRPILFLLNPPYGTAGSSVGKEKKVGINSSLIREEMRKSKFGGYENIQHQFMYRIYKIISQYNLTNAYMVIFSNPIWITGSKQANFLINIQKNLELLDCYLFKASYFLDVSEEWGVSLTIWKSNFKPHSTKFEIDSKLIEKCENNNKIRIIGNHLLYNSYNKYKLSDWIKEPLKGKKTIQKPCLISGLNIDKEFKLRNAVESSFASLATKSNSISGNAQYVYFLSTMKSDSHDVCVCDENFLRCTVLFTARRLIKNTWINHSDEYLVPNIYDVEYKRFQSDSVIYSLFNSKSCQTSMRQINYGNTKYDILNEFFWISKSIMLDLARQYNNIFMIDDINNSNERYVYNILINNNDIKNNLSTTSKLLLEKATELVINSMQYRELFNQEHPDYYINTWDAGYYQLKNLWKKYLTDDFNQFSKLYKQLESELIPLVYKLGFLKNI